MSNAVNTDKYRLHMQELMPLFCDENRTDTKEIVIKGNRKDYKIHVHHYSGSIGEYHYRGAECFLYAGDVLYTKWHCFNDSSVFYQLISHKNGKEYLIFRQDLYGYSVLDMESGEIMQFFPECSFEGVETFIWTKVHYHPANNVLAVEGCYWACPYGVQLFDFENPMSENPKFVDIISCLDGDYDVYDELKFLKWEKGDLYLKAFLVENSEIMELVIPQEQYLCWLGDDNIAKHL
ncbi:MULTISPECIES: hypothetical protein [unclassified Treponema]|uniref:hypothetical protein n=1 Tax=unclassified Treponema TaxID=2638727 RepID=UPI0020A5BA8D|nr:MULTISPECIES: hypothetical protein [unclassified Treponema]UTC66793.1 cysteine synthase [Treponema sp. OMZ 789]UTC69526.1 cysteine synthase [Treponema sp. OMZ 790]UTC72240.1 cysteine synthase [Treponema sp. OMZ 791]